MKPDTQPVKPVLTPDQPLVEYESSAPLIDPEPPTRGAGCTLWGIVGLFGVLFSVAIVGLAGVAGWTNGQRTAQMNITATRNAEVALQINLISTNIANGNTLQVDQKLSWLVAQTPGIPQVDALIPTATALYLTSLPTSTPTATATPEAENTDAPADVETVATSATAELGTLLQKADDHVQQAQYLEAIDKLEIIESTDPQFERFRVRQLLSEALQQQAFIYFRGDGSMLAQGVQMTIRAKQYSSLKPELALETERYVAELYLSAKPRLGTSENAVAIADLQEIMRINPNYFDVSELLAQYGG